uniref:Uncharacterized protein n=1 Tax=Anas zonorhyncha TaxID=75864 RepID=A0A8B9UPR1_9AVES
MGFWGAVGCAMGRGGLWGGVLGCPLTLLPPPPPENRLLPTELRREALALQRDLEFDTPGVGGVTGSHDDEYQWAGLEPPKVMVTTSRDPSARLRVFVKVGGASGERGRGLGERGRGLTVSTPPGAGLSVTSMGKVGAVSWGTSNTSYTSQLLPVQPSSPP